MQGVILAGGFGTRLRPLTCKIPKPMLSVANKPLLEHVIRLLKKHNITDLILILYFQPQEITSYFRDGKDWGVKITYVTAQEDLGTAGSVKNAEGLIRDNFLVISGDVLTDFDLKEAILFHQQKKSRSTLLLTSIDNPLPYGIVITNEENRVERFLEKPTWGQVFSDTINTGIYILEKEILSQIPTQKEFDFSKDLFPLLLKEKSPLFGFVATGYWRDIGNLDEYWQVHQDILERKIELAFEGELVRKEKNFIWRGKDTQLGREVVFEKNVILGKEVFVDSGTVLSSSCIGNSVKIGKRAKIFDSVIADNVIIGDGVILQKATVGRNSRIGDNVVSEENVIVSEDCEIEREVVLKSGTKIWPGKRVEEGSILSHNLVWGEKWTKELFTDAKVTGLANWEITPEFAVKLGAAWGAYLGKGSKVVTSRDAGKTSRMLNRAIICGLLSSGVNVFDLRTLPIPVVRYQLKSGTESSGIHVRHSPLDEKLIDIIFFDLGGTDIPTSKVKAIERLFFREDFPRAGIEETGQLDFPQRVIESYRNDFLKALDLKVIQEAKFKIVVDYSWGGASEIFPSVLGALGCELISLNAYLDTQKIFASKQNLNASLEQLGSIVKSLKADIGFLLDTGAERIYVVDENGEIISQPLLLLLVTELFLSQKDLSGKPIRIAVPVVASRGVEEIASLCGAKVIRVANDHLAMMEAVSTLKVDFVGGTKGGFIFPPFGMSVDAMFALAKILELMAKTQIKFGEIKAKWNKYFSWEEKVFCDWSKKGKVMRKLLTHTQKYKRELIDGVRIFSDKNWVWITPGRREPHFYLFAEGTEPQAVRTLVQKYSQKIVDFQK